MEKPAQVEEVSTEENIEIATEATKLSENNEIWTDEEGEISFKHPKKTPKKVQDPFVVSYYTN